MPEIQYPSRPGLRTRALRGDNPFGRSFTAASLGGGGPGGTPFTWNPVDAGASTILSDGNLVASSVGATSGVRGTRFRSSGKYYFEVVLNTVAGATNSPGIGVAAAGVSFANTGILIGGGANGATAYLATTAFTDAGAGAVDMLVPYNANDTWGVAVDITAGKIWWCRGSTYTNSGDPVAGTNNVNSFTAGTPVTPVVLGPGVVTARFAKNHFIANFPPGFSAWS